MFKKTIPNLLCAAAALLGLPSALTAVSLTPPMDERGQLAVAFDGPSYWNWTATPPMGWNNYDARGSSVKEEETLANAQTDFA